MSKMELKDADGISAASIAKCRKRGGLMGIGSKINPLLTLEYMQTENENKYFDRQSGQIRVADLASHISAFAAH